MKTIILINAFIFSLYGVISNIIDLKVKNHKYKIYHLFCIVGFLMFLFLTSMFICVNGLYESNIEVIFNYLNEYFNE